MSYQEKISVAIDLIKKHNEIVGNGNLRVNENTFESNLKSAGITSIEHLKSLRYEDILPYLDTDNPIKPKFLAKDIANKAFREKDGSFNVSGIVDKRPISYRKVDLMTLRELVDNFDPLEPYSPIGKRLSDIAKDHQFIVFSNGQKIDVAATLMILEEIKMGYTGRETIEIGNELKEVYKIGQIPNNEVDENPLYPNRPLRPDGTCDQTQRSWAGVPLDVKQLIYLAVKTGDISITVPNGHVLANDIISVAIGENPTKELQKRFSLLKARTEFVKLQKDSQLPRLKITLNPIEKSSKGPLENGKKITLR